MTTTTTINANQLQVSNLLDLARNRAIAFSLAGMRGEHYGRELALRIFPDGRIETVVAGEKCEREMSGRVWEGEGRTDDPPTLESFGPGVYCVDGSLSIRNVVQYCGQEIDRRIAGKPKSRDSRGTIASVVITPPVPSGAPVTPPVPAPPSRSRCAKKPDWKLLATHHLAGRLPILEIQSTTGLSLVTIRKHLVAHGVVFSRKPAPPVPAPPVAPPVPAPPVAPPVPAPPVAPPVPAPERIVIFGIEYVRADLAPVAAPPVPTPPVAAPPVPTPPVPAWKRVLSRFLLTPAAARPSNDPTFDRMVALRFSPVVQ